MSCSESHFDNKSKADREVLSFLKAPPLPAPFIVGNGRSGNTLMRLMLDSHPELAIPTETDVLPQIYESCAQAADPRQCLFEGFTGFWRWPDNQLDDSTFRDTLEELRPFNVSDGIRIFFLLYAQKFGKRRWGDKSPYYLKHMPVLQEAVPEARFIHMIRDGRDMAVSTKDLWFGPNSFREAAELWQDNIREARRQAKLLNHYMEVRFEDLVLRTEDVLKTVCDFLELPWTSQMLRYHQRAEERIKEGSTDFTHDGTIVATVEQRHKIHALTSKPPQIDRIGRYKTEMPTADQEYFASVAGPLLHELGYMDE